MRVYVDGIVEGKLLGCLLGLFQENKKGIHGDKVDIRFYIVFDFCDGFSDDGGVSVPVIYTYCFFCGF